MTHCHRRRSAISNGCQAGLTGTLIYNAAKGSLWGLPIALLMHYRGKPGFSQNKIMGHRRMGIFDLAGPFARGQKGLFGHLKYEIMKTSNT